MCLLLKVGDPKRFQPLNRNQRLTGIAQARDIPTLGEGGAW